MMIDCWLFKVRSSNAVESVTSENEKLIDGLKFNGKKYWNFIELKIGQFKANLMSNWFIAKAIWFQEKGNWEYPDLLSSMLIDSH